MIKKLLLFFFLHTFLVQAKAQNFSNKGKDFWVGYGYHQVMQVANNGNTQDMVLYFATDQVTTVTVSIPGIGYTQTYPNIAANTIFTTPALPKVGASDARLLVEGVSNKGIHIESTKPVVAYAHIYNSSVSGACVLLPTPTLGKEYFSINYTNNSNTTNANSWFYVVAADTGTTNIEIVPSANTTNGWIAGNTYTVTLTQGQIYNVMGALLVNNACGQNGQQPCTAVDLTGSKIRSIASGTGGCKKIAVFSGSGRISLTCNNTPSSSDNYMVQAFPKSAWGKKFLTVTTGGNMTRNIYRVCVADPATIVKINGVVTSLPLINNFYYEISVTNAPLKIEADLPITVAQYIPSQGACGNGSPGDPEVIYLSPVEQSISNVLFNSNLLVAAGSSHFANVVIPNGGTAISSFTRDGVVVPPASFTVHPQDPAYSYIKIAGLNLGQHTLVSDSGFNAIAYGFAQAESYGYNAGTNVRDFNQNLEIQSLYGIINEPSSCSNSPFSFRIYLPDSILSNSGPTAGTNQPVRFDSMKWNVTNASAFAPNNFPVRIVGNTSFPPLTGLKVAPDSLTLRNGKSVAWYSIPNQYAISTAGTYTITITGYRTNNNADGCNTGNETEYEFDLIVANPPLPTFSNNQPGCPADSVRFVETTPQGPTPSFYPTYSFWWSFDDPASGAANNTSNLRNPVHRFSGPGTYTVRFATITTPGCLSDTIDKIVTVPDLVNATLTGTTAVCQNAPPPNLSFTIAGGLPPYRINYTLSVNGGAAIPQTPIITSTPVNTLSVPTTTAGVYAYNITSVENANAAFCTRVITGQSATVTINPLPSASITGGTSVCQNAPSPAITLTGSGGTAPYTFNYTLNGSPQSVTSTGNVAIINAPTNATGTFSYAINSVRDASTTNCLFTYTTNNPTAVVVVQPLPTAIISGSASVCQNGTAPQITFNGSNGTAPYQFTYNINGGAAQTISTSATSSSVSLIVPMITSGTFVYNLTNVQASGSLVCANAVSGASATVVINPVPTAAIAGTTTVCQNSTSPNITFTGANATAPYTFTYTINGGAPQTVTTTTGNSVTVAAPTVTPGVYVYALTQVGDASTTQCLQTLTNTTATVTVRQLASATITGSTSVCQSSTAPNVTFTATGGIAPFTFSYTLNGTPQTVTTITGNSVTVPVSTATPGIYTFALQSVQESSSVSCTQLQTGSVVVTIRPKPTASFTSTGPFCQFNTITITPAFGITPTGNIASWVWDYGDGTGPQTRPNGNPFTLNYPTAGSKTVTFKTVSDLGCESNVFTANIIVNSKPNAGFINPAACLADAQAQFTDTSTVAGAGASIVYWEWDFGDGSPIYAGTGPTYQNPLHSYAAVGQKTVQLIVTTNSGCKDTTVQQFFINGEVTRASFTALNANNLCSNRPVQIQDNSIVNVGGLIRTDIYWDYANAPTVFDQDNTPAPGKIYTHNYPNLQIDRTYSIRYFAYSGFNGVCQKDTIINIIVRASPVAQFFSVPDVCLNGGPVVLNQGTATGGTGVYMGPGVTFSGGVYTFNPLATGVSLGNNNAVIYTVSSPAGCDSARIQQIKVLAPPVVNSFGPSGKVCQNTNIVFNQTSTMGDGVIVRWIYNWNDGTPNLTMTTGASVTHLYATSGPHTATLTLETASGCRNIPFQISFNVDPKPLPDFTFSPSACLPQARIDFVNTTPPVLSDWSYKWYFVQTPLNSQDSSTQQSPNHIYTSMGPHEVTLRATSPITGCTNFIMKQVNSIHKAPVASFNFDIPSICVAQSVTVLQNSTPEEGTLTNWSWSYGDNSTAVGQAPSAHTYTAMGTYNVTLTATSSFGCTDDTTRLFIVYPFPVVNAGPDDVVLEGGSFNMAATATGNSLTYLWTSTPSPTYLNSNTVLNPTAKPLVDVTYKLSVTAQGGCTKADSVFIKVLKFPEIPNTFTPNNDGIHDFWEIKYLFTYPGNKVQVFTRTGQKVFESNGYARPWDGNMNGKSLPFDTYYYIIEPGSGRKPITGYVTIIK